MSVKKFILMLFAGVVITGTSGYSQTKISIGASSWFALWSAKPTDVSTSTDKGIGEAEISPGLVYGPNFLLRFKKISIEVSLCFGSFHFDYGDYGHYFDDQEGTHYVWEIEDLTLTGKRTDFLLLAGYYYSRHSALYIGFRDVSLFQKEFIHYSESRWNGSMWKYERDGKDWYSRTDTKFMFGVGMSFAFRLKSNKLYLPVQVFYFTDKLRESAEIWDAFVGVEWRTSPHFLIRGGYRANLRGLEDIQEVFHGLEASIRYHLSKK